MRLFRAIDKLLPRNTPVAEQCRQRVGQATLVTSDAQATRTVLRQARRLRELLPSAPTDLDTALAVLERYAGG